MLQASYQDQFTPFHPNCCVDRQAILPADKLGLALYWYTDKDEMDKYIHYQDVLMSSLYANGVLGICMKKSLEAYLENRK